MIKPTLAILVSPTFLRAIFTHLVKDQPNGPFTHFGRKAFPVVHPDILSRKEVSWILGAVHSFRTEVLDANIFSSLGQVREFAWAWLLSYNEERPHAALGNIPPAEFKRLVTVENSSIPLCA